jgi:hypothetical protein
MAEVAMTVSVDTDAYVSLLRAANESGMDPGDFVALIIKNYLEENYGSV